VTPEPSWTREELMVIEAARRLRDGEVVFAGTGLPLLATTFAQKTHAPDLVLVVESGSIAPQVLPTPISISDAKCMHRAVRMGSLREVLGAILQRGLVDVGFLGGAQIDPYANINSTVIGEYGSPTRRLPGSGGANDIASLARQLLIITHHEKRRFPPACDYVTSPGYLGGPDGRRKAGLKTVSPRITVVTDLGVLVVNPETGRLELCRVMPGITAGAVQAETGFELPVAADLAEVTPPDPEQVRILRDEVDPRGLYLKTATHKGDQAWT
jgi:glutaconate CoA-transferase, subunit B